jgi:CBS domain-containing protein
MKQTEEIAFVNSVMHATVICRENEEIDTVAKQIITNQVNHIVVVDDQEKLKGIVTSWDITKAVAEKERKLAEIITRKVVTTTPNESLEQASRKMAQHTVSALPVVDHEKKVLGIITSEDISKLLGG